MTSAPYAFEIDDSTSFTPYLTKDAAFAQGRREAGKRVVDLYADPRDLAQPTAAQRSDSQRAQMIVRDAEAMAAIRRLRVLSGVDDGVTLVGVAEAIERRIRGNA